MSETSTYKLCKVSGGITLFGEVPVSVSNDSKSEQVLLSEHVFDWLKEAYGPNATIWPVTDMNEFVRGARKGIEYVLKHLPAELSNRQLGFEVERIYVSEVDSSEDSVAYAACFAAWQALGLKPISPPMIEGRQIIFAQK